MGKVIFSIQYEISANKRDEYIGIVKELKNLLKADGLENYSVYEVKGKHNNFEEIYIFSSSEAYENFDDNQNERLNILINKLSDLTTENSTKYTTLYELTDIWFNCAEIVDLFTINITALFQIDFVWSVILCDRHKSLIDFNFSIR